MSIPREGGIVDQKVDDYLVSWLEEHAPYLQNLPSNMRSMNYKIDEHESRIKTIEGNYSSKTYVEKQIESINNYILTQKFVTEGKLNNSLLNIYDHAKNWVLQQNYASKNWTETNFVNHSEFSSFLSNYLTPEFVDNLVINLADINIGGVKQNLVTALQNRPTFTQIPTTGIPLLDGSRTETIQYWISTQRNLLNQMAGLDGRSNTVLTQTLGDKGSRFEALYNKVENLQLPDVSGMLICFTGGTSNLRALTIRLNSEVGNASSSFNSLKIRCGNVKSHNDKFKNDLKAIFDRVNPLLPLSGETARILINVIRDYAQNIRNEFDAIEQLNNDIAIRLDAISSTAGSLFNCGKANLKW